MTVYIIMSRYRTRRSKGTPTRALNIPVFELGSNAIQKFINEKFPEASRTEDSTDSLPLAFCKYTVIDITRQSSRYRIAARAFPKVISPSARYLKPKLNFKRCYCNPLGLSLFVIALPTNSKI